MSNTTTQMAAKGAPLLFLILWSSGAIVVKLGLQGASAWSFLALRAVGSFLVLLIALVCVQVRVGPRFGRWRDGWTLNSIITGVLMQVAYQGAYFLAISERLSLGLLTIILGCQPIVVSLLARECFGVKRVVYLLMSLAGLILAVAGSKDLSINSASGLAFALTALASIATATVLQSKSNRPLLPVMLVQYAVGSVAYLLILIVTGWRATFDIRFVSSVAWMILVVSIGATFLLFYMLAHDVASRVSSLFFFIPVLSMGADKWIFGTPVSFTTVAGRPSS